ncbi:MAG: L-fucose:H+ symporter permease [Prevotella sp.]|nr:L-fucose:H+ symporter permease [Prevotella sp.]
MSLIKTKDGRSYLLPFVLITSLFFLWGFAHSILDVLNKHFQDSLQISKTGSALVQAMVYGGYFLMAIPAGKIISRWGYRTGVITGLLLYGTGALLFIPGAYIMTFWFFLMCLFIIGCGLTCLETAANPYVTVLGDPESAERRINLSQSFNGLGWIVGPLVGGLLLFDGENGTASSSLLALPYAVIGVVVLIVALIFSRTMLPEPAAESPADGEDMLTTDEPRSLWSYPTFVFGLVALFLYVAAQTGLNSFFINYATENADVNAQTAAVLLGFGCMGLFMLGRMGGSWLMSMVRSERVLAACGVGAVLTMAVILFCPGSWGIAALLVCYLCESIMFPTIFALAIKGVGRHTKQASSYLIMSIVGGAVAPLLMGLIADTTGDMRPAFTVPMVCYAVITAYAVYLSRKRIAN